MGTCPTEVGGVRTVWQVGNFKREYLANHSDSAAHLLSGKRAYGN